MAAPRSPAPPLSAVLPPLILGTATFNTQYVTDPLSMPYERIVSRALELGVTAFDTSPYYGPSEDLLGRALAALDPPPPRSSLTLITKAGRVGPSEFDYSPSHIRRSVFRSLRRLRTPYLDLVYAHDVEFVSPAEVLSAVRELRRLRDDDQGGAGPVVRHVGISGYPVDVLCDLAELVRRETGEPLDAVMSYGHFTVQNRTLGLPLGHDDSQPTPTTAAAAATSPLARLRAAGVGVVLNASMLGMGLLTSAGIPPDPTASPPTTDNSHSPLAKWHPSPPALRLACKRLSALAAAAGERLESVAIRWSLGEWARVAGGAGVGVPVSVPGHAGVVVGASVMGVTSVAELEETVGEWEGVLVGRRRAVEEEEGGGDGGRDGKIVRLVEEEMWPALGAEWLDYSWASPGEGFVNQREARRDVLGDDGVVEVFQGVKTRVTVVVKETVVSG
ncbi:Aldo/keto reductase family-domain-containing protein [Phialemonium atrogriseum]|uniref:Aldo/keto reductase family-domain-containing protein n=1 Tax=Phialemonium atrogriseum TaxID=1093897 RepID=A0AAJ0FMI6_9PEZI|nr:Aldo/keto reductase family-domain-containing protein [Phialemonium atrogriseum]KAK1767894.1 Aldo/keto reductase family-domain-containing protein [Phialemonium atrogriseum]